jgi:hypothetical protein
MGRILINEKNVLKINDFDSFILNQDIITETTYLLIDNIDIMRINDDDILIY